MVLRKILFIWSNMPIFKKPDNQQQIYKQTSSTLHTSNDMSRRKNVFMDLKKKKNIHKITIPAFWEGNLSVC